MCNGGSDGLTAEESAQLAATEQSAGNVEGALLGTPEVVDSTGAVTSEATQGFIADAGEAIGPTGPQTLTSQGGTTTVAGSTVADFDADGNLVTTTGEQQNIAYDPVEVTTEGSVLGNQGQLLTGQADLSSQINTGFANIPQTTVVSQQIDTSDLAKLDQVNNLGTANDTSGIAGRFGGLEGGQANIINTLSGDPTDVNSTGLVGAVDTGFMGVNEALGDTGTSGTITDQIGGAVTDIRNLGSDELDQSQIATRFGNIDKAVEEADVAAMAAFERLMGTDPATVGGFLGDLQTKVLTGQTTAQTAIDLIKKTQAENQVTNVGLLNSIDTSVGGSLAADFGDFTKQYTTDASLATNARADLQKQITGGVDTLTAGQTAAMNQVAAQGGAQQSATEAAQAATEAAARAQTTNYGQLMRDLNDVSRTVDNDSAADVLNRLDTIRQVLNTQGLNIDENIRRQYSDLATAFDQTGKLITQSVDQNGNTIRRGMDDQNNLLIANFDSSGKLLFQTTRDINFLLSSMDRMGYARAGGQFGDLTASGLNTMTGSQTQSPVIQQNL